MGSLYRDYFYVPKDGKVREKVMLTRAVITVAAILACLIAMSFTAYAYFTHNVISATNEIKAASFSDVDITVSDPDGNLQAISKIDRKMYAVKLESGTKYTVVLKHGGETASTGFFVVTANGSDKTYHTQQLGVDHNAPGGKTSQISFSLSVSARTTVYFLSHWGTSSYYSAYEDDGVSGELYITNQDDDVQIPVNEHLSTIATDDDEEKKEPVSSTTPPVSTTAPPVTTKAPITTTEPPESQKPDITEPPVTTPPPVTTTPPTTTENSAEETTPPAQAKPEETQPEETQPEDAQPTGEEESQLETTNS